MYDGQCSTGQIREHSVAYEQRYNGRDEGVGALKRIGQIEFSKFLGADFDGWLYKVN